MNVRHNDRSSEHERLDALASFSILDTPREADFDDVAELASRICETPIAVVNLIGEGRQFFKAEVGLGVRETPLESSFCARAILEDEFLVVPDATKDPRFDCNPLVTGDPQLRFYAGALLKTDDGHAIGTVCVLDMKPRDLSPLQEKTLRVLARQVMNQLNLRRALAEKAKADARQAVLNQELSHRLKNSLAMVQAIALQTLKKTANAEAYQSFERRIEALGQAHELLLSKSFRSASVHAVVKSSLFLHNDGDRLSASGPEVNLGPNATLSLSLILHELATNAVKYGSLSNSSGNVDISWRTDGDEWSLIWKEMGGPTVRFPGNKGFGSRLIRLGMLGNRRSETDYAEDGIATRLVVPIADLTG
ncbi:blue-light-activated histidine kinase [Variibacter gotjawalensis]|uniref:histidine kinase n=1 Tax=Variibacter gotjawalensis TaxID=1333996 RepID=A0A0S3PRL9_9BRAD|nr:HWE histidine kinase domain-containing protein [Variibacter gotjawalensis]NIK48884.1 two-component sensor histidine kinase [Variibacter gotjawalensis]RZS50740.1 two-component sensor histidine kinase [Variibacter gotjawalensis]BAT58575.1 blue-light-activated histidine kinase [Variibacter gotjawalensis]